MLPQQHYWSSFFIIIIYHYLSSVSQLSVSSVHCSSVTACFDTKNRTFLHVHIQYAISILIPLFPFPFSWIAPKILPFAREFPFLCTCRTNSFLRNIMPVCPEERRGTRPRTTFLVSQNFVIWSSENVCNSAITAEHGFHIRMHQRSFVGLGALCSDPLGKLTENGPGSISVLLVLPQSHFQPRLY